MRGAHWNIRHTLLMVRVCLGVPGRLMAIMHQSSIGVCGAHARALHTQTKLLL